MHLLSIEAALETNGNGKLERRLQPAAIFANAMFSSHYNHSLKIKGHGISPSGGLYDAETIRSAWVIHGREVVRLSDERGLSRECSDAGLRYLFSALRGKDGVLSREDMEAEEFLRNLYQ